jgi:hypothetical protein
VKRLDATPPANRVGNPFLEFLEWFQVGGMEGQSVLLKRKTPRLGKVPGEALVTVNEGTNPSRMAI